MFIEAKDDGGGGDNWSYGSCKAPVKSSPPMNQHPVFLQAGCPTSRPTNSVKALNGKVQCVCVYCLLVCCKHVWCNETVGDLLKAMGSQDPFAERKSPVHLSVIMSNFSDFFRDVSDTTYKLS